MNFDCFIYCVQSSLFLSLCIVELLEFPFNIFFTFHIMIPVSYRCLIDIVILISSVLFWNTCISQLFFWRLLVLLNYILILLGSWFHIGLFISWFFVDVNQRIGSYRSLHWNTLSIHSVRGISRIDPPLWLWLWLLRLFSFSIDVSSYLDCTSVGVSITLIYYDCFPWRQWRLWFVLRTHSFVLIILDLVDFDLCCHFLFV